MQITVSLVKIENIYRLFGFGDDKKKKTKQIYYNVRET